MHRQIVARRWARLLGAAVLGGALSVGVVAALPAEAATTSRVSSGLDLSNLTEDGSYSDSGANGLNDSDQANGLSSDDQANGLSGADHANGLANGLSSGDLANGLANGLSSGDRANGLANGLSANGL
ncbi:MAG TPA: hypothetical protein VEX66_05095 [Microlunatus sp.]|jgi:hypothetical protein|nr:hypothetical protein [Microlunatus sp.]